MPITAVKKSRSRPSVQKKEGGRDAQLAYHGILVPIVRIVVPILGTSCPNTRAHQISDVLAWFHKGNGTSRIC